MSLTYVTMDVGNPATPAKMVKVKFLVDSGAVYSVIPSAILHELGIKPLGEKEFHLANGDEITRPVGGAYFRLGKAFGVADVIFGEPGDSNLLGATTLESLGLMLNPLKRELMPLPLMLAEIS